MRNLNVDVRWRERTVAEARSEAPDRPKLAPQLLGRVRVIGGHLCVMVRHFRCDVFREALACFARQLTKVGLTTDVSDSSAKLGRAAHSGGKVLGALSGPSCDVQHAPSNVPARQYTAPTRSCLRHSSCVQSIHGASAARSSHVCATMQRDAATARAWLRVDRALPSSRSQELDCDSPPTKSPTCLQTPAKPPCRPAVGAPASPASSKALSLT